MNVDIVIFGGGIAGLWALNRLRALGYHAILLETTALGAGQTIKSQGIIHGGIKYALTGFLSGSANAIEQMPHRWKAALLGTGEIDLHTTQILSHHQLLWSTGSIGSEIAGFFASKALNSRVQKVERSHYPTVLHNAAFKGHVYRLEEVVLDTPSLIRALATPHSSAMVKINSKQGYQFQVQADNPHNILSLKIFSQDKTLELHAKRYLFTAGEGNQSLLSTFADVPRMQVRPLQMVMVKIDQSLPFFAHCIDQGINPRITITTHLTQDGKSVWYLGGQLAEDGAKRTPAEQIAAAKKELAALFPWLDFSGAQWASFFVNRAEPEQPGGKRPDNVFLETVGNKMIAWPTKLALTPVLIDQLIIQLQKQSIHSSGFSSSLNHLEPEFSQFEKPNVALPPWDEMFE